MFIGGNILNCHIYIISYSFLTSFTLALGIPLPLASTRVPLIITLSPYWIPSGIGSINIVVNLSSAFSSTTFTAGVYVREILHESYSLSPL